MKKAFIKSSILPIFLLSALSAHAAQPVNLSQQPISILPSLTATPQINFAEIKRSVDFNHTLHIRFQEMYASYPVIGGDAILHIPNQPNNKDSLASLTIAAHQLHASMNGTVFQDIGRDLTQSISSVANAAQLKKAIQHGIGLYEQKTGAKAFAKNQKSRIVVYIDHTNKAHWAYQVSFDTRPFAKKAPERPTYIMDASNFTVYQSWNDIKTIDDAVDAVGGGFGGNEKLGKLIFDGAPGHLGSLAIQRNMSNHTCILRNKDIEVQDSRDQNAVMQYDCQKSDPEHNNVYWNGDKDAVNGAYSPSNDALYGTDFVKNMYQAWYHIPVLEQNGKSMFLPVVVHDPMENAYWDGSIIALGDSDDSSDFYPFTSLGVIAHEMNHGFTEQHSALAYYSQSGGLNESFSDMSAQAAEYYAFGHASWQIGPEIMREPGKALRYMDQPSKDCEGRQPGDWCSIDNMSQYTEDLDVHFSSGIPNRVFYLLSTSRGWDVKKAYDVMVQANSHYWTSNTTFAQAACGVLKAADDYHYDTDAVATAFVTVGVSIDDCVTSK